MKFKRVVIQNFLSIKYIELDLENRGLILLKGKNLDNESLNNNGAGKSSIIESIVYALYGRTLRGLKGDAVVHKIPGKNMKIFLDLEDDNGDAYRIARYRKHTTNKNKSFLYHRGRDITPKSEMDFNDYIADLLQADYLTFTSSLLYSAESFKFTSATDSQIKDTFDIMLGLDIYQKCLEIAKNRLKLVEGEIDTTQWKINDRRTKIEGLETKIKDAEQDKIEYDETIKEKEKKLNSQIKEYEEKLEELKGDLREIQEQLELFQAEKDKAERQLKIQSKKLKEVDELKEVLQETKDDIQDQKRIIRTQERIVSDNLESIESYNKLIVSCKKGIETLQQRKEKLNTEIGSPCPTCGQPMTKEAIEPAKKEYDEKIQLQKEEIIKYEKKIEAMNTEIMDANSKIKDSKREISELEQSVKEFETLIAKSKKLIDEKTNCEELVRKSQEKYYDCKSLVEVNKNDIKYYQERLEKAQKDIKELSQDNPYDSIISKYKVEQEDYKSEITEYEDSIQDKLDEQDCLLFWQKAYSNQGIKSFVLDDITPFLNKRVNKYLSKLTSGHIEVKFNTQSTLKSGETREKFSIEISNQDGGKEYSANSGGERKRIDLAINLALQDLVASRSNKRINIAMFDEVFDALDETGVEQVIELLQELSKEKSSIFVISHNDHLKSYFTNIITVTKKDGFSTIEDSIMEDSEQEYL